MTWADSQRTKDDKSMADAPYIEQLQSAIGRHFSEIARARAWTERSIEHFHTGARVSYESDNLIIRIVNERRLLYVEIASASYADTGFTVSRIKDWLEPAPEGRWNLSLAESARFLATNWSLLDHLFSPEAAEVTVRELCDAVKR